MRLVIQKLVQLVLVLLAVTFLTTFLMSLFRGGDDAILASLLGPNFGNPEAADAMRERLHLNENVVSRWILWMGDALRGDFGLSGSSQQPVGAIISSRVSVSLALVVYAQLIALAIAVPLGVLSAHRQGTLVDRAASTTAFGLLALPSYVVALLLILIFPFGFGIFPAVVDDDVGPFDIYQLFLPALALALGLVAVYVRLLRTDMIATLQEDFIGMAKAKGMPVRSILFRHALRPSSFTLLTVVGLNVGQLIGGAVIIEFIFNINGMGSQMAGAVLRSDYVLVQSGIVLIAAAFITINFA
ncbi:MAG: ABC transporter permease, partial [Actinomycetota bacterium]|nr:ABC transporter permease [Actinomycetota bacterium]